MWEGPEEYRHNHAIPTYRGGRIVMWHQRRALRLAVPLQSTLWVVMWCKQGALRLAVHPKIPFRAESLCYTEVVLPQWNTLQGRIVMWHLKLPVYFCSRPIPYCFMMDRNVIFTGKSWTEVPVNLSMMDRGGTTGAMASNERWLAPKVAHLLSLAVPNISLAND